MTSDDGLYITAAQMQFFLNRREGEEQFKEGHPEFLKYYHNCCLYNLIYDMMLEDESCAKMYWDTVNESVAMSFPTNGIVAEKLSEISFEKDEEEEPDDEFGLFK